MTVSIEQAVEEFFDNLRLAPRSKKTYRLGVRKFLKYLSGQGIDVELAPVTAITASHITQFAASLVPTAVQTPEDVAQMRTAQNNISAVRKFCYYLEDYDMHPDLATRQMRAQITSLMPRFAPPPPTVKLADLERIVEHVRTTKPENQLQAELRRLKVRAMILFLHRTGVRVSELVALRRRDINLYQGTADIYRPKGSKSRTVHFDSATAQALVEYWQAREDPARGAGQLPAFSGRDKIGTPGPAISPRTVEHIVTQLCKELDIESEITPHSFRHALATEMLHRNVRESTVQTIMGHASPQTTRIYVDRCRGDTENATYQPTDK
jgi:site-specific recombinase XerD